MYTYIYMNERYAILVLFITPGICYITPHAIIEHTLCVVVVVVVVVVAICVVVVVIVVVGVVYCCCCCCC